VDADALTCYTGNRIVEKVPKTIVIIRRDKNIWESYK
jgi:hypothetical protein